MAAWSTSMPAAWSFDVDTGVLSARVDGRSVRIEAVACTQ
jgi:hypothetical protein